MASKSTIYMKDVVENENKKFGELPEYQQCHVVLKNGDVRAAWFTVNEIKEAMLRTTDHPEANPKKKFSLKFW